MVEKMADDRWYMIIYLLSCSKDSVDDYTGLEKGEHYSLALSRIRNVRFASNRDSLGMRDVREGTICQDGVSCRWATVSWFVHVSLLFFSLINSWC